MLSAITDLEFAAVNAEEDTFNASDSDVIAHARTLVRKVIINII